MCSDWLLFEYVYKTIKININTHGCFLINCRVKINKVMMNMYISFPDINTLYYLKLLLTGFFLV